MEQKSFESKVVNIDDRTVTGISAVAGVVDAGNDLIYKGAFTKTITERGGRVKHLWQHDNTQPPIATVAELKDVGRMDLPADMKEKWPQAKGGLLVKRQYLNTPRGNEVLEGIRAGAISEMSIGYDAVKFDFDEQLDENGIKTGNVIRNLRELRLWDTSDVNWGMNEATVASFTKTLPFVDTGVEEQDTAWEEPKLSDYTSMDWEDLSDEEKKRIAAHYAWSINEVPSKFEDLKLPHHKPSKTGVGPAARFGVKSALTSLADPAYGVPSTDIKACLSHLAQHCEQYNQKAPELAVVSLLRSIAEATQVFTEDPSILEKMQELNTLLRAEPPDQALTLMLEQEKLLRRLALKRRQASLLLI